MLRNVILVSSTGIYLYSKEFIKGVSNPGMIGGLVTAMLEFSGQRTGLPVSFIELKSVGIAISINDEAKVICALFYDVEDGPEFGKLISNEILQSFVAQYASSAGKVSTMGDFSSFNQKISEIIRNSVGPVLDKLQSERGIMMALMTTGDQITHSTVEVDKITLLANIQALVGFATDIMSAKNDLPERITMKGDKQTIVVVRVERSHLVVVCKNSIKQEIRDKAITESVKVLRKVVEMVNNLQTSWSHIR